MSDFTRDRLVLIATEPPFGVGDLAINLAAFALAQLDRAEKAEELTKDKDRTLAQAIKSHLREVDKRKQAETINAGNQARAEKAEALLAKWEAEIGALMPEDFKDWHENAIEEHPMVAAWCLNGQRENADHAWELLQKHLDLLDAAEAERDRLRAQLDSILANSDSLESGKLADANAEIARLREKLRAWQEKSDRHESERDSFRLEADRLREKGAWLQAEVDVLRGKACDEEQAAGNGPCGVCRNCAWAERDRLREELLVAKVAWDMRDTVNRRLREENKSLREANEIDLGEKAPLIFENAELKARNEMLREELREVLRDAGRVMGLLAEHGASILPHLMDDDENPGERLRQAVRRARERKEKER